MTDPRDRVRARVVCRNMGSSNCLITGEGFYGGAAEVTLANFDMVMTGRSSSNCIQLNEGHGGAYSPYWQFYVERSGRQSFSRGHTLITDMDISGCGRAGIKLSTFITGVVMSNLRIHAVNNSGIELRNGNNVTVRGCVIEDVGDSGILIGGGSRHILVEFNTIRRFGGRGVLVGSDNTEVQYMDVEAATKASDGSWHDAVNCTVRDNVIAHGAMAGLAFYSARDVVAVHNTVIDVGKSAQGAVILNLSPKTLNSTYQVLPANRNISMANNIFTLGAPPNSNFPMVEARIMQGTVANDALAFPPIFPGGAYSGNCSGEKTVNRLLTTKMGVAEKEKKKVSAQAATRVIVRNADGSCQQFPEDNPWHMDVTKLPVHPNADSIRRMINQGGTLHPDFGGGQTFVSDKGVPKFVPYGIPINTVNTVSLRGAPAQPLVPLTVSAAGYPSECDYPLTYPFPTNASVEGAYLQCPDRICGGDRHVLVVDNTTCMLYESWRSFSPGTADAAGSSWLVDVAVKFDLTSNSLRPLGLTSADAAGLPVTAGLVQFDEVVRDGEIKHALRFTGRNSRAAYAFPATHYAPTGDTGPDSPWMGMRVRLNASFNCAALAPVAKVFCVALKKYGGIFADNGAPWFFSGEGTTKWLPYVSQLQDIGKIPATMIEILDSGCLCLDALCTLTECSSNYNGNAGPSLYPINGAVDASSDLQFSHNYYFNANGGEGRFVDRRAGFLGKGFDGDLVGWQKYSLTDNFSVETNPLVDAVTYRLSDNSPAHFKVPLLPVAAVDIFGRAVPSRGGLVDAGVLFANYTPAPSTAPTWSPIRVPTRSPSSGPTVLETRRPSPPPTLTSTRKPSAKSSTVQSTARPSTASPTMNANWRTRTFQSGNGPYNSSYDIEISSLYSDAKYHNYNGATTSSPFPSHDLT